MSRCLPLRVCADRVLVLMVPEVIQHSKNTAGWLGCGMSRLRRFPVNSTKPADQNRNQPAPFFRSWDWKSPAQRQSTP